MMKMLFLVDLVGSNCQARVLHATGISTLYCMPNSKPFNECAKNHLDLLLTMLEWDSCSRSEYLVNIRT